MDIVLGTNNLKKGQELAQLLAPYAVGVKTLADFKETLDIVEDGKSFIENARKKAVEQAKFLGQWVIGEDSGLSVDRLGGEPGIYSARYAAKDDTQNASDEENNKLLLQKLLNVPLENRTARYTCAAAFAGPDGTVYGECEQYCCGRILMEQAGTGGFGYDPLFEVIEYHQTFGQLSPLIKKAISHRARTMRKLIPIILSAIK